MSVINDIETLARSVESGLGGSLKEISDTYHDLPENAVRAVTPIGNGVEQFAGSMQSVIDREMGQIKKGLDRERYGAILKQADKGVHLAALDIAKELEPYAGIADTVLSNIEHFDLTKAVAGLANSNYAGEMKSLLQTAHDVYHGLCASKRIDALPQMEVAFKAAALMLETMPDRLLGVLEKGIPLASVESLLAHLDAACNEDNSVGLRATHTEAGADNSTISYLKMGSKVSRYLEEASYGIGEVFSKEMSITVNAKIKAFVGVVGGWAAAVDAKLGIGGKGGAGISLHTVPFDAAAPFFVTIGLFFGLLGIGLSAVAEWSEVDMELA